MPRHDRQQAPPPAPAGDREKWVEKARTLSDALLYMRRYMGETFVV
ncbi:MAG: hypothetical protein U1E97_09800 [Alphaproteobacteria bacterium]